MSFPINQSGRVGRALKALVEDGFIEVKKRDGYSLYFFLSKLDQECCKWGRLLHLQHLAYDGIVLVGWAAVRGVTRYINHR